MTNIGNKGEIVIYISEDGKVTLDTKLENETIWLTEKQMAEFFGVKTLQSTIQLLLRSLSNQIEILMTMLKWEE